MARDQQVDKAYLAAEAKARVEIDRQLEACGWLVQDRAELNLYAGPGVAVREFTMAEDHGRADYLLFVDRQAVGTIEAKPKGTTLTEVEIQSSKYATGVPGQVQSGFDRLPFAYESTGVETRFTNGLDPDPRSRPVFAFHRPETMAGWIEDHDADPDRPTLRHRLRHMPPLEATGLWQPQFESIENLEASLANDRPRALIQMATGSGKTFTAANVSYRLIKHAGARRVLFLVDRSNLGRQTLKEFQQFSTPDDKRKFTELYNVQHLNGPTLDKVARVTISTIQRLYSILRGEEIEEEVDERSAFEIEPSRPVEVVYNPGIPIETYDVVIVDEAHRSIYGVWRQVLEYFDAYLIGLTATPSKQTFGFFDQNLVMEYDHSQAVADGVNVDFDVYKIATRITKEGSTIDAGLFAGFRDRETRQLRWDKADEPIEYAPAELDRKVVAKDQLRTVVRTFKDKLFTEIFPGRSEVPKTLIFAKDDSHADDVVQVVREEFGKGNEFAQKITYRTTEGKPDDLLAAFRNTYNPRIVVTVDMIATGTDIKPLECIVFMRATRSRTFFEQMKGRAVRVINDADFRAVTPDATAKTHFVIVDAVGVTETELNDTQPLERKPAVPLQKLMNSIAAGSRDADVVSSVASRLARLERQITKEDRDELSALAGVALDDLVRGLVTAIDPDHQQKAAQRETGTANPTAAEVQAVATDLIEDAVKPLAANPELRTRILDVRRSYEQTIDETSKDEVTFAGASKDAKDRARAYVTDFRHYLEEHRDEITALQLFYNIPFAQRPTFEQIKELAHAIERTPQRWTPERLWEAYEALDRSKVHGSGRRMLTDLVSIVRFSLELTPELVGYGEVVDARFEAWLAGQEQGGRELTEEQMRWLGMIRDHIAAAMQISIDDFQLTPFAEHGGTGKAVQVLGPHVDELLEELNRELMA